MQKDQIRRLIELYLNKKASLDELEALLLLVNNDEEKVIEVLNEMQLDDHSDIELISKEQMGQTLQKVLAVDKVGQAPVLNIGHRTIKNWYWVAASVIVLLGVGLGINKYYKKPVIQASQIAVSKDIQAPDASRAMITLADGKTIYLDSLKNGELAALGNITLVKLANGQIAYQSGNGELIKELQYNTLSNPRGSKVIDMVLSDGTHVWLNAGSSITYPVAFLGDDRKVKLTGEGYFEVAHNAAKPFYVSASGMEVKVLGTHFNVNAYEDDGEIKTTLLEGSVEVTAGGGSVKIKPGEQARLNIVSHDFQTINRIDTDQVMAWKNGYFSFEGENITGIMNKISRWYDVDVIYEGQKPSGHFSGIVSRELELSKVLYALETYGVKYELVGKKLIIK